VEGEGGSGGSACSTVGGLYAGGVAKEVPEWWWGEANPTVKAGSCRLVLYVEPVAEP